MNRMIDITGGHCGSVLAKIAITLLAIPAAVIWGILTLLYCVSWIGNGSLLFALSPAQFCVLLSVVSPIVLYRAGRSVAAIAVAGLFLVLGLLVGTWVILIIEST
jgi:hypothetical protein